MYNLIFLAGKADQSWHGLYSSNHFFVAYLGKLHTSSSHISSLINLHLHDEDLKYFRGSLAQNLYIESLALTSATFASAIANLIPAVTFILAVPFGYDPLSLSLSLSQINSIKEIYFMKLKLCYYMCKIWSKATNKIIN